MDDGVVAGSAPAGLPAKRVRWSAGVEAAVIAGTRAGMVLARVCASPGMPCVRTVVKRAASDAAFGAALRAAREAAGLGVRGGPRFSYCAATAEAICARLCAGEAMVAILRDVEMPGYSTLYRWLAEVEAFRDAVALARDIQGLRLAELGWEDACAVTPETAFALRVKLEHLRWYAGKLAPKKYGPMLGVRADGAEAGGRGASAPRLHINITEFERSKSGQVMAVPPRCEKDEALYLETYGQAYDGPRGAWKGVSG